MVQVFLSSQLKIERANLLRQEVAVLMGAFEEEGRGPLGQAILDRHALGPARLGDEQVDPDFDPFREAKAYLVEVASIPWLGLVAGARRRVKTAGVFGIGMATSVDLAHSFQFPAQIIRLLWGQEIRFKAFTAGGVVIMRFEVGWESGASMARMLLEESLLQSIGVLEETIPGLDWSLAEIRMRGTAPSYSSLYPRYFPCSVRFLQDQNELRFPAEWLTCRPVLANPGVASYCESVGKSLLLDVHEGMSLRARVRCVLEDLAEDQQPSFGLVAERLEMSERVLRNGLTREGVTFRDLLQVHRLILARKYLRETHLPIKEIAFMLGFAHLPSFYRAFTREAGETPDRYRAVHRNSG